jgi:hypothetical protein
MGLFSSGSGDAKKARQQAAADAEASRQLQQSQWNEQKALNAENKAQERMMRLQGLRSLSFDRERRAALKGTLGFKAFKGQGRNIGAYKSYKSKFSWGPPAAAKSSAGSAGYRSPGQKVTDAWKAFTSSSGGAAKMKAGIDFQAAVSAARQSRGGGTVPAATGAAKLREGLIKLNSRV